MLVLAVLLLIAGGFFVKKNKKRSIPQNQQPFKKMMKKNLPLLLAVSSVTTCNLNAAITQVVYDFSTPTAPASAQGDATTGGYVFFGNWSWGSGDLNSQIYDKGATTAFPAPANHPAPMYS